MDEQPVFSRAIYEEKNWFTGCSCFAAWGLTKKFRAAYPVKQYIYLTRRNNYKLTLVIVILKPKQDYVYLLFLKIMKKILYITYDGITDPLGQSQILPYLAGLSGKGYEIHILSFEKRETFSRQKSTIDEIVSRNHITWHYRFFTTRPKYISKYYDLFQLKRTAIKLHRQFRFDAVHGRSYIAAQPGLLLKKKFGVKLIFDMRGFWIDERIENGQWNKDNLLFSLLIKRYRVIEKALLESSDSIISLTQKAKDHLVKVAAVSENKITVIPCCVDMELFNPTHIDSNKLAELKMKLGINETDYLVTYSGSLGGLYLINETMAFFKKLKQQIPQAKLLVLSRITIPQLKPYLDANQVEEKDVMLCWSNRADMPYYLAASKLALCFIRASFSKIASSPTKLAEYLAMGIPVVVNAGIGDDDEIIKTGNCGVILNSFSENELERGIFDLTQFTTPHNASIECAEKQYSLQSGIAKYLSVYKKV